ncbi:hypothetical protein DXC62_07835, partial [Ruminococcaceae bacterium TF06-43]
MHQSLSTAALQPTSGLQSWTSHLKILQDTYRHIAKEALFTSTSAVCVTGLVVQDTGSYWSAFG